MRTARHNAIDDFVDYLNGVTVSQEALRREDEGSHGVFSLAERLLQWLVDSRYEGAISVSGSYVVFLQTALLLLRRMIDDPHFRLTIKVEGGEPRPVEIGDEETWADKLSEDAFRAAMYIVEHTSLGSP